MSCGEDIKLFLTVDGITLLAGDFILTMSPQSGIRLAGSGGEVNISVSQLGLIGMETILSSLTSLSIDSTTLEEIIDGEVNRTAGVAVVE